MTQFMAILFLVLWVVCGSYVYWQWCDTLVEKIILPITVGAVAAVGAIAFSVIIMAVVALALGFTL